MLRYLSQFGLGYGACAGVNLGSIEHRCSVPRDWPHSEQVSEVLLIPAGTVRSRLNRTRAMLRAAEGAGLTMDG